MFKNICRLLLVVPVMLIVSCEDEDAIRIPEFDIATNFRVVRDVSSFDSTNPDAGVTLTVYSESDNIQEADMYVSHFSLIENQETRQFPLATLQGSEITNDGSTKLTFSLDELTAAMNKTPEDLAGGDAVNIYSIVTLTDGRIYPDTVRVDSDNQFLNVTPNIIQSSSTTSFSPKLVFPILCELDETFGTGTYSFEAIEGDNEQFGVETFETGNVTITSTSSTGRTFDVPFLTAFVAGFTTTIEFDFACNVVLLQPTGSGLGCSGNNLVWDLNAADPGQFDIMDDSEFTISITFNTNAACGISTTPIKFRLTKQ